MQTQMTGHGLPLCKRKYVRKVLTFQLSMTSSSAQVIPNGCVWKDTNKCNILCQNVSLDDTNEPLSRMFEMRSPKCVADNIPFELFMNGVTFEQYDVSEGVYNVQANQQYVNE